MLFLIHSTTFTKDTTSVTMLCHQVIKYFDIKQAFTALKDQFSMQLSVFDQTDACLDTLDYYYIEGMHLRFSSLLELLHGRNISLKF